MEVPGGKGRIKRGEEEENKEMRNLAEQRHCRQFCGQDSRAYMHLGNLQPQGFRPIAGECARMEVKNDLD